MADILSDNFLERPEAQPRRLRALARWIRYDFEFVREYYRLGLPAEVRYRLDNPLPVVIRYLWRAMYGHDFREEVVPPTTEHWKPVKYEIERTVKNLATELEDLRLSGRQVDKPYDESESPIASRNDSSDAEAALISAQTNELADLMETADKGTFAMPSGGVSRS